MNQIKTLSWAVILAFLIVGVSCKGKKKVTDITDKEQVKEEIAQAIEDEKKPEIEKKEEPLEVAKSEKLNQYFSSISQASNASKANADISQTLSMFSSSDALVLIEIYSLDGTVDYDEPTTISKYLNYLKDTNKKSDKVQEIIYDDNGKIKELVLRKSF
ncbi:MAG: nucleoid-structuring protein H-NS [Cyclobacteriaceae bacterium]